jgi:hypothetical protein
MPTLKWSEWLLLGLPLITAGLLILIVVELLGWQAQPASPWGRAIAGFFYENPYSALILLLLGGLSVGKAVLVYR